VLPPCPHCDQPDVSLLRPVLIEEILRAEEPLLELLAEPLRVWSVPTGRRSRGARGRTGALRTRKGAGAPAGGSARQALCLGRDVRRGARQGRQTGAETEPSSGLPPAGIYLIAISERARYPPVENGYKL
jgi:hypothetical protein